MAEISNKTLALLLVSAIIISLGGTFIALNRLTALSYRPIITGMADTTDTGTVTLNIGENVAINFTSAAMDWGSGAVDGGDTGCLVQNNYTNGSATTTTGDPISGGNNCTADTFNGNVSNFVVENIGNTNVTLNITGKNARQLFEVSGGNYSFNITAKPGEIACVNDTPGAGTVYWTGNDNDNRDRIVWTPFINNTAESGEIALCNETGYGMPFADGNDEFYINIRMNVPYLAYGTLTDTITLEATTHTK